MLPREVTIAVVEEELVAMRAYGSRHGWAINWLPENLVVLAEGRHPDGSVICLHADVEAYKAQPPAWSVIPPGKTTLEPYRFPSAGALPGGIGSICHSSKLFCAPFNRLAFKVHGGPHADWSLASWLDVRGTVQANTLADMLAIIASHLHYSPGWN